MPTKGLGLGFFAPLPNPVMIPMMGLQSAVMGYTFGVYFQYSKRLIGSLSNEQFNKIRANPTELSKIVQRDVGEMFSLFDPIADDTRKLQTKIVQEMIGYIKQLPQDILGGISGIDQTQFAPTPDQSYDEYVASFNSNPDTEYLHTLGIGAAGSGETMSLQEWQRRNAYLAEQNKLVTDSPKKKDESLSGEYKHYYDKIDKMSRQTLSQELARVAQGKNKFGKKKLIKDKLLQRYNFLRNQDLAKAKIYSDAKKSKKSRDEQVRKTGKSTVVTPPKETVNIEDPITFNNHVLLLFFLTCSLGVMLEDICVCEFSMSSR